jgi:hypothetical protein
MLAMLTRPAERRSLSRALSEPDAAANHKKQKKSDSTSPGTSSLPEAAPAVFRPAPNFPGDVRFASADGILEFEVHKETLSLRSPVFAAILEDSAPVPANQLRPPVLAVLPEASGDLKVLT